MKKDIICKNCKHSVEQRLNLWFYIRRIACKLGIGSIFQIYECKGFEAKPSRDYIPELKETEKDKAQLIRNREKEAKRNKYKLNNMDVVY